MQPFFPAIQGLLACGVLVLTPSEADAQVTPGQSWNPSPQETSILFLQRIELELDLDKPSLRSLHALLTAYPDVCLGLRKISAGLDLQTAQREWLPCHRARQTTHGERLKEPTLVEMLHDAYPSTLDVSTWPADLDPGRYRCTPFFKSVYGKDENEVRSNLVGVDFLGRSVSFNRRNGAADALRRVAARLARQRAVHPEWEPYLKSLGGTFNWRTIAGTAHLSAHCFGIAIDLNPVKGAYWRWSKRDPSDMTFRLGFPPSIIEAFEAEGFIWGGKWSAYDLMHFEFRPEFFVSRASAGH